MSQKREAVTPESHRADRNEAYDEDKTRRRERFLGHSLSRSEKVERGGGAVKRLVNLKSKLL